MWIKNYVLTLISIVIFSSFVEILMPSSNMKKHISLISGIVMIIAISKPIIKFPTHILSEMSFQLEYSQEESPANLSDKLAEVQNELIEDDFSNEIISAVQYDINTKFKKNYDIGVLIENGTVKCVILHGEEHEKIAKYIKQTYGFECMFK